MKTGKGHDSRGTGGGEIGKHGGETAPVAAAGMERQRAQLSQKTAGTMGELEQLRIKQRDLEKEKESLQRLARRQEEYEQSKKEIMEKLARSIVLLEKEREQAVRMVELLGESRERFQEQMQGLEQINEEKWPESDFKDDLDSALAQVEAARTIYRKAMGRIDAASWHKSSESTPARNAEPVGGGGMPRSFLFWLKVGVAIALPLIAAFGMLTVFLLHRLGYSPAL